MPEDSFQKWPLTTATLECESLFGDVEKFKSLAAGFDSSAWLLAMNPRQVIFRPWLDLTEDEIAICHNIIISSPDAELRWEKPYGKQEGFLRLLRNSPGGDEYQARRSSYILRKDCGAGRLLYEEYFKPDECGFLIRKMGRLCGKE